MTHQFDLHLIAKALGVTLLCATLAACGGDDDPAPVASDPASNQAPAGDGGGASGGGDGDATGGGDGDVAGGGDVTGGGDATGGGAGSGTNSGIVDGTPLAAVAGGEIVTVTQMTCQNENPVTDIQTQAAADISFNRSTLDFVVNGDVVFAGGFAWSATSSEWSASRDETTNDILTETRAKVDTNGKPTYYYFKRQRVVGAAEPYFAEVFECYENLQVANN